MSKQKILITGITGQDGIFLTKKLLEENNNIHISGFSRNAETKEFYKNKINNLFYNLQKLIQLFYILHMKLA